MDFENDISLSWPILFLGSVAAFYLYRRLSHPKAEFNYLQIAERKRMTRDAVLREFSLIPAPAQTTQNQIVYASVTALKDGLAAGRFTSEEILLTFIHRIINIGVPLEAVADVNFYEALEQARDCDKKRAKGQARGLLFGIPISVKDSFLMKGLDSTCGMVSHCFDPMEEDGLSVQLLKSEGAIPFVKSNLPMGLMSLESENRIWGNTKNPWNETRSAGGSSGGEAALVSSGCSPLGLATDMGGSIRYPSSVTGLYGFIGTGERGSIRGSHLITRVSGGRYLPYTFIRFGPIGQCVSDLVLMMKTLWSPAAFEVDRLIPKLPFDDAVYANKEPLVVAVVEDTLWELPICVKRALAEAVEALKAKGYTVVKADINVKDLFLNMMEVFTSGDIGNLLKTAKGEEPWTANLEMKFSFTDLPKVVQSAILLLMKYSGKSQLASVLSHFGHRSSYDLMRVLSQRTELVASAISHLQQLGAEALIMPAALTPACELGQTFSTEIANVHMTSLFNLGFPCGVVPITLVRSEEEGYNVVKRDPVSEGIEKALKGAAGLPIGIQVAALPFRDEVCLRVMRDLEEEIKFRIIPGNSE